MNQPLRPVSPLYFDPNLPMPAPTKTRGDRARPRTFSSTERDFDMLEAISHYHGTSKSAMITGLIRKEFWRAFPNGTDAVPMDAGAKVTP